MKDLNLAFPNLSQSVDILLLNFSSGNAYSHNLKKKKKK